MNNLQRQVKYFKSWIMFIVLSTVVGGLLTGIACFILGYIAVYSAVRPGILFIVNALISFVIGVPISYFCFKWAVSKYIIPQLSETKEDKASHIRNAWILALWIVIVILGISVVGYLGYIWSTRTTMGLSVVGGSAVSSETLVNNLSSEDSELVMTSLNILEKRQDPQGKYKARELLKSEDDYIWFNAAQYLGSIRDEQAVPYLIKGLKHPAWRSLDDVATYLESITSQKFGKDQEKWIAWWQEKCPESAFDFSYPKLEKEALELTEGNEIFINGVADPLTIRHTGPQIKLIGIKLKDGVDGEEAAKFLKTVVLGQFVELAFDSGPKLDEKGARRAFVYWCRQDSSKLVLRFLRKGLGPVPFKEKTLINTYLLKSGLYEIDPKSVYDQIMRNLLIDTFSNEDQL